MAAEMIPLKSESVIFQDSPLHQAHEYVAKFPGLSLYIAQAPWALKLLSQLWTTQELEEKGRHSVRVAANAEIVGKEYFHLPQVLMHPLIEAAFTHDVGFEGLDPEVLKASNWSDALRDHAQRSVDKILPFSRAAAAVAIAVHRDGAIRERDGAINMYPTVVPLALRDTTAEDDVRVLHEKGVPQLLSLLDKIDAMRAPRMYREINPNRPDFFTKAQTQDRLAAMKDTHRNRVYPDDDLIEFALNAWDIVDARMRSNQAQLARV